MKIDKYTDVPAHSFPWEEQRQQSWQQRGTVSLLCHRSRDEELGGDPQPVRPLLAPRARTGPLLGEAPGQRSSHFTRVDTAGVPQGFTSMKKAKHKTVCF